MELISVEQLEVLMFVVGAEDPVATARAVRQRWRYILSVAEAAMEGSPTDQSLPYAVRGSDQCIRRAQRIVRVLDEWLAEQAGRPLAEGP